MHDGRHTTPGLAVKTRGGQTRVGEQGRRVLVGAAPCGEGLPGPPEQVLPPGQRRPVGSAHVLDDQQPSSGTDHAAQLAEGSRGVGHGAQHHRRHCRVEAGVGKRQRLRRCRNHAHRRRAVAFGRGERGHAAPQPPHHCWIRLGEDQLVDPLAVARQVEAGARADLQDAPLGASQQPPPTVGHPTSLGERKERLVGEGGPALVDGWSHLVESGMVARNEGGHKGS